MDLGTCRSFLCFISYEDEKNRVLCLRYSGKYAMFYVELFGKNKILLNFKENGFSFYRCSMMVDLYLMHKQLKEWSCSFLELLNGE